MDFLIKPLTYLMLSKGNLINGSILNCLHDNNNTNNIYMETVCGTYLIFTIHCH